MASCSKHPSPQVAPRANNNPEAPHSLLQFSTIFDAIDDLCSRFINNLPEEELMSAERLCFQVEQAHWYYEDFIREENPHFSHVGLKRFTSLMFNRCPLLKDYASRHDETFEHFMQYKTRVPVCGAIMLNSRLDKCVLVKGWKASSGWGFPKGKINQQESPANCAIREVLEETGYNIADKLVFDQAIELSIQEQHIVLFLIRDVPEDFEFKTRTRKEISAIEWWHLADLPTWKTIRHAPRHAEGRDGKNKFYLVTPFVGSIKTFIDDRHPRRRDGRPGRGRGRGDRRSVMRGGAAKPHAVGDMDSYEHESGSQSSSVDNGDPQTPSPVVQEPAVEDVLANITDPHMIRLMSSLKLSVDKDVSSDGSGTEVATPRKPVSPSRPSEDHFAPEALAPELENGVDDDDWSVRSPRRPLGQLPDAQSFTAMESIYTPPPAIEQRPKPTSLNTLSLNGTSTSPFQKSPGPFSATIPIADPTSATSGDSSSSFRAHSVLSRRSSASNTDISPYLSRPTELPSSGKHLRQLALLETVANESARMTPALGHRASQVFAAGRQSPAFAPLHPALAGSVPPPLNVANGIQPYGNFYSSPRTPGFPPMNRSPYMPSAAPTTPYIPASANTSPYIPAAMADYHERPRTSNAMRPLHQYNPLAGNRVSMDQGQLYNMMMSRPRAMAPPIPIGGYNQPPAPVFLPPMPSANHRPVPYGALDYASPPAIAVQARQPPQASAPPSNALLSILNASPNGVSQMGPR